MGRLTKRFRGDVYIEDDCTIRKVLNKLAHYEDLEEQGRLIELPCAVGDTVYCTYEDCNYIGDCRGMKCEDCIYAIPRIYQVEVDSIQYAVEIMGRIGKTAFLTEEEAEAKLKELKPLPVLHGNTLPNSKEEAMKRLGLDSNELKELEG